MFPFPFCEELCCEGPGREGGPGTKQLSSATRAAEEETRAPRSRGSRHPAAAAGDAEAGGHFPRSPRRQIPSSLPAEHPPSPEGGGGGWQKGPERGAGFRGRRDLPVAGSGAAAAAGWQHVPAGGPAGHPPSSLLPTAREAGRGGKELKKGKS